MVTTASPDTQLSRIAKGGALNVAGSLVAGVSGVVLTAVVTNAWSPSTAGMLFSGTSLFLILTATALLGTDTGLARFVLRYEALGRSADIVTVLRSALRPVVVVAVLLGVGMGVGAPQIAAWLGQPDDGVVLLRVLAVALPLAVISDACLSATRAFGAMRATVVIDRLLRSGGQPLAVAAAALLGVGIAGLSVAWSLPYLLAAVLAPIALTRLLRSRRSSQSGTPADSRPQVEVRREFWRYTWLRGIARVCQVALQRADIVMVAALRSPAEAALYTAATRFVVLGQLGVQAVQQVLQPRLSQLLAAEDRAATRRVFSASAAWIMAMAWPVYVTAIVAAPVYLSVFGPQYVTSGELVVVVMGLAMLFAVAAGPVDVMLLMSGRSALSLLNNLAALTVNIGLNLVLIPRYGIDGAAVSWAVALVLRNALPFVQVKRSMGETGLSRAAGLVVIATLLCFGAPMLLLRLTVGLEFWPAVGLMVAETVAYALLLWRWRGPLELAALRLRRGRRGRGAHQSPKG